MIDGSFMPARRWTSIWRPLLPVLAARRQAPAQAHSTAPTRRLRHGEAEAPARPKISGAEQRAAQKESVAIERRLMAFATEPGEALRANERARCLGLCRFGRSGREQQQVLQDEIDELEMRCSELSEILG